MPRVRLDEINSDDSTQSRVRTDDATVESYAESMKDGDVFPPVVLFRDADGTLWPGDGIHRIAAARLAGHLDIDASIIGDGSSKR